MKVRWLFASFFMFLLVGLAVPWSPQADACGPVGPFGRRIAVANESAIIIWDAEAKTQHFIRRASFSTDAKDFGFLVPSPTRPELGDASDQAFQKLETTLQLRNKAPGGFGGGAGGKGKGAGGVEVLEEKRVAGQDVAVLKANDADALAKWLKDHEYEFSPSVKEWVKPYIDSGWIITASKYAKDRDGAAIKDIAGATVRMSFKTEKPFFPYREPSDQRNDLQSFRQTRLLRIFFISNTPAKATVGGNAEKWIATPTRMMLNAKYRDDLLHLLKLPHTTGPASWWLTVFEDRSSPRPGLDELYFHPDGDPEPSPARARFDLPDSASTFTLLACLSVPGLMLVLPVAARFQRAGSPEETAR